MGIPQTQLDIGTLARDMLKEIPQRLSVTQSTSPEGHSVIEISDEISDPSLKQTTKYELTQAGIKGPDPIRNSDGKSLLSVAIENIAEYLGLVNLDYDPQIGMYRVPNT